MLKFSLPLWKSTFYASFRVLRDRTEFHFGIGNRCSDGMYVVFLDYDNTPLEWVREEIRLVQERKGLGNAYLFETKHGFHVIFLVKVELGVLLDVLDMTSIDKRYRNVPLLYARKIWVLRQTEKPGEKLAYCGCYPGEESRFFSLSSAHRLYLERYAGVPDSDFVDSPFWDDQKEVILGHYKILEER